jgi:nucleoside-diphosphate-sugar epimerase
MLESTRIFLTGATGFIGRALAALCLQRGFELRALVRSADKPAARWLAAQGARLVVGDLTDRESMREAMQNADLVLHLAGYYELGISAADRARMTAVNVQGTDKLLGLALEIGCPRVLHVSSALVYGDSMGRTRDEGFVRQSAFASHYDWTKTEAHRIALGYAQSGLPLVIACPNAVVGVNDHSVFGYFLRLHLNHLMPPVAPCPDTVMALVHVEDVARGLLDAALRGRVGECYFFSGQRHTLRQLFEQWQREIPGGMAVRWWVSQWAGWMMLAPVGPLLRAAGLSAFLSAETARQAASSLDYSAAKAERELQWSPTPAAQMWRAIGQAELASMARRRGQSIKQRLEPLID